MHWVIGTSHNLHHISVSGQLPIWATKLPMSSEQYIHPHGGHAAQHGFGCLFGLLWGETSCQRVTDIFAVQSGRWPLLWQRNLPPETLGNCPRGDEAFSGTYGHMVFGMLLARMTPYGFWDALGSWHNTKILKPCKRWETIQHHVIIDYRFI